MNARFLSVSFLSLMLMVSPLSAEPTPGLQLSTLVNEADIIVLGTIADVTDLGAVWLGEAAGPRGRFLSGRIDVRQVLKGPADLDTLWFRSPVWTGELETGRIARDAYGILLLTRRGSEVEFASPYFPMLETVRGPRIEAVDPLEAVVDSLAAVLRTPAASASMKRRAILRLWGVPIPATVAGLRVALKDRDRTIQLAAAAALLSNNDVEALPLAEGVLLQPGVGDSLEAQNLRVGLRSLKNPAAVPALTRLVARGDLRTRREATVALGQTGSNAALRALGRALDDEDFEVRYNALRGLAEATGQNELNPGWDAFREDEARHKSEWKARLAALGVELP